MGEQSFTKKEEREIQKIVGKFTKALKRKKDPDVDDCVKKCSSEEVKKEVRRLCKKAVVNSVEVDFLGDLGCPGF